MVTISREYHAHSGNYTPGGNRPRFIVVHNTGNTADARAEARYAQNDQHPSSYHYVLDGRECFQILDDTDTAWAVGAWSGATQYIGNRESVSVEVCSNGVPFTPDEIAQLREVVHMLMERHGIPAANVVRHFDCHSGRKSCPSAYVNDAKWLELRKAITSEPEPERLEDMEFIYQTKTGKSQKWYDGHRIHPLATPAESAAVRECYRYATGKDMVMRVLSDNEAANFEAAVKRVQ